jgi:GNAT superfamily N-acetyltransferase
MVHPAWRRRGVGRLLIAHLESAAYTTGYRQIWLETHAAWDAAARFYESLGFRAAD